MSRIFNINFRISDNILLYISTLIMVKINSKRKYKNSKKHWHRKIWRYIRIYRIMLDNYTCQKCKNTFPTKFLRVHHRSYARLNTPYEILDCVTVCDRCHSKIHNQ